MAHYKDYDEIICPVCGEVFLTKWNDIYCSEECKKIAESKKDTDYIDDEYYFKDFDDE